MELVHPAPQLLGSLRIFVLHPFLVFRVLRVELVLAALVALGMEAVEEATADLVLEGFVDNAGTIMTIYIYIPSLQELVQSFLL